MQTESYRDVFLIRINPSNKELHNLINIYKLTSAKLTVLAIIILRVVRENSRIVSM